MNNLTQNRISNRINAALAGLLLSLFCTTTSWAGAYIFAGDGNGIDLVAHPIGYTGGSNQQVTVKICLDAASQNVNQMNIPVANVVNTWNALQETTDNVNSGVLASGDLDAESVLLHEVGHCIGLGHPNFAASVVSGNANNSTISTDGENNTLELNAGSDGIYGSADDIRGDDVNLHWFNLNNNPFVVLGTVEGATYKRDVIFLPNGDDFVANADRNVSNALGFPNTEASMQQTTFTRETQRELAADDVSTLLFARAGIDRNANTSDDYTVTLNYQGIVANASSASNCDISISIDSPSSFAFCSTGGQFLPGANAMITSAEIHMGTAYQWFFNDVPNGQDFPPAAPVNVQVIAGNAVVDLTWNANSEADLAGYRVNRSNSTDGPYTDISGLISNTNFSDNTVVNGSTYFYVINAEDNVAQLSDDSIEVTATPDIPNILPVATFIASCSDLNCSFDATGSSDSDGAIVSYSWDFGDGNNATGATPNHRYVNAGSYQVILTVTDDEAASVGDVQTVVAIDFTNFPPTAAFTLVCNGLTCTFGAAGSGDSDGTIVSYSWDFGDSTNGTGINPNHSYVTGGNYNVSLTVTDNDGATDVSSGTATTTSPPDFASADFNTVQGSVTSGSFINTQTQDGVSQELTEFRSGGRPADRHDLLEHIWEFNVIGGNNIFNVRAHRSNDSNDLDTDFIFSSSTGSTGPWTDIVTVTGTEVADYSGIISGSPQGTVFIRVIDNNRDAGNQIFSTLLVDHMYINGATPPTNPPGLPTIPIPVNGAVGVNTNVTLSWTAGDDSGSHRVYFDGSASPVYEGTQTTFNPGPLAIGTTYSWRVDEVNSIGTTTGTTWSFTTTSSTGPSLMVVDSISVSTVNVSKGNKNGLATVVVRDDSGNLIADAEVTGTFTGTFTGMLSDITDATGTTVLNAQGTAKKNIAFEFCIDSISHDNLTYTPPPGQDCGNY